MKVKTHPTSTDLSRAVTVTLSLDEALGLANLLGCLTDTQATRLHVAGGYDALADGLETIPAVPTTVSQLLQAFSHPYVNRVQVGVSGADGFIQTI